MPTFVPDEVVTAAKLNQVFKPVSDQDVGTSVTVTNTAFADLDALTGGALTPVICTVTTDTTAMVSLSATVGAGAAVAAIRILGYRVSGATTVASSDFIWFESATSGNRTTVSRSVLHTGLTPGVNVFEVQARTTTSSMIIRDVYLTVVPV